MNPKRQLALVTLAALVLLFVCLVPRITFVERSARGSGLETRAPAPQPIPAEPELIPVVLPEQESTSAGEEDARRQGSRAEPEERNTLATTVRWLRQVLPERFAALTEAQALVLEELDLRGAPLTDTDLERLATLPNLRRLSLRDTRVTDRSLAALRGLLLESLDLRDTTVTGGCLSVLPAGGLRALHLTGTKIRGDDLARLPAMPALQTLKLNGLSMTDAAVEYLAIYPALRHVEVDSTAMTAAGLRRLLELNPQLSRIEARGTGATEEGVRALRSSFPECEIVLE